MMDNQSQPIGSASGFVFNFCINGETKTSFPALVTNRHVFNNCQQVKVLFTQLGIDGNPDPSDLLTAIFSSSQSIPHPNKNIDLSIMLLGPALNALSQRGYKPFYTALDASLIPSQETWADFDAIENVTMVGYPKGLRDSVNNLPIFRRGITATHPRYNYQGEPKFLVDMACFKGSSGSPVFLLNEGSYTDKRNHALCLGTRVYLMGIQHAVPEIKELGELLTVPSSQVAIKPVMPYYINLGLIIKSTELLAFEPIFQAVANE